MCFRFDTKSYGCAVLDIASRCDEPLSQIDNKLPQHQSIFTFARLLGQAASSCLLRARDRPMD